MKTHFFKMAGRALAAAFVALASGVPLFAAALAGPGADTNLLSLPALQAKLDALVNEPRFRGAEWGVKIVSLDTGATLYENHPERLLSPASNSKLYASALALDTLGGDYRFTTPILATAKPGADGTLAGDLIVSGRDDPSWKSDNFPAIFTPFITVLRRAGVTNVTGDLVADATFYRGLPSGGSWCAEDLEDSDGAEISALTLADNAAELRVAPGARAGDPCAFTLDPPGAVVHLVNLTTTVPAGGQAHLEMHKATGTNDFFVFGQLPLGGAAETLDTPVPQPARWFGAALKTALAAHGIAVQGGVRALVWPAAPPWRPADLYKLGEVQSPPLREIVRSFMKASQNLETDLVFDHAGELTRQPGTSPWATSEDLGVRALDSFLAGHGIPADVHFDEGSGLSRNNLTSARATVALLAVMATNRWAADYYAALPVAGVDGTLRNRMKNPPAFRTVHAKTGTLRWANSLSGYVTTAAGERLAFSLMLNRYATDRRRTDDLDAIAALLAGFKGRSGG